MLHVYSVARSSSSLEPNVTLKQWEDNRWLKLEPTSRNEIANLLAIVDRDLQDARSSISCDWQFGIAYNAALKLCTILLRAEGYRAGHGSQHYRTIMAMPMILAQLEQFRKARCSLATTYDFATPRIGTTSWVSSVAEAA